MSASDTAKQPPPKRRMTPDERRKHIVDAARPLFAQRPLSEITTADVAEAAGVARTLVHHYFGGISNVFLAVVAEGGAALADRRTLEPPAPLEERLAFNIPAALDVVSENRELWYAAMGHAHSSGDAKVDAVSAAVADYNVQRSLEVNRDVVADTPVARAAIRSLLALAREATRLWLDGHMTREQTEAFLITSWHQIILHAIPAAESAGQKD